MNHHSTKILFVNPPVIRSANSAPHNNFKIEGPIDKPIYRKIPVFNKIWKHYCRKLGRKNKIRYGVRAGSRWPWTMEHPHGGPPYPFFMGYAASFLQSNGYPVNIIDAVAAEEYSYAKFISEVKKHSPEIVILETATPTIDIDLWVAEQLAQFTEVCLAGPHSTIWSEEIIKNNKFIKYILKGEYILSSLELVQTRRKGIYETQIVNDLDQIPYPFRDFPEATQYYDPTMPTKRPQLQIYGSKGCPFKCIYCMWPPVMYQGTYTPRSPQKIIAEIKLCQNKYGYQSIFFDDDTFNLGNERISELCDGLAKIGLPWTMMGRLDTSPEWLFAKMVDCGCVGMRFGVETFDLEVSKNIKKGLQLENVLKTLTFISAKFPDLYIHLTMMKNMPGQTEAIHQQDIQKLKDLGYSMDNPLRNFQLSSCAPFPGTELYAMLEKAGHKLNKWQLYDGANETIMKELNT
jgi:anaerobic magnesium-protoporphyrin IX monomethyl ester cyclase